MTNKFSNALITNANWSDEVVKSCQAIIEDIVVSPDIAIVFVSPHFAEEFQDIADAIQETLQPRNMIGCVGDSIVSGGREIEGDPAITIWAAALPDTKIETARLLLERVPDRGFISGTEELPFDQITEREESALIVLGEPFSFPADLLLSQLAADYPELRVIGGMASGFQQPGKNLVLVNGTVYCEGAAGLLIDGGVKVHSVVSQGCRPIGDRTIVTKVEQNLILELGGKPAMQVLEEMFIRLPTSDHDLMSKGFFLGRVISEYQDDYEMGDFLIRNVMSMDNERRAVVVNDYFQVGQTVQFQVRDEETASNELRQLLKKTDSAEIRGGLVFTCNGRGTKLFAEPDHDAGVIRETVGEIPLAGFFAQGEIGPVGRENHMHGYTASVLLFE
jgi:small ligand-binding sensory domain FIST|tara:strand:+ start:153 stop:1322 length:1170 start_codon:yes stop_codon:yes gene_type:complete